MTKQEFLKLFELEEIYSKYKDKEIFGFGLFDNLIGTENIVIYNFNKDNLKLIIECVEFSQEIQQLEIHLKLYEHEIEINQNEIVKNELFPFLTFDTNFEAALKFLADFLNKILKPKYQLMGKIFIN